MCHGSAVANCFAAPSPLLPLGAESILTVDGKYAMKRRVRESKCDWTALLMRIHTFLL